MTTPKPKDDNNDFSLVDYGRAMVNAMTAFKILETKAGWFERWQLRLLTKTYRQRLRAAVEHLSPEVSSAFFNDD